MNAKLYATEPKKIEFTLTATFTLEQWLLVDGALGSADASWKYPLNILRDAIHSVVAKARKDYLPDERGE